MPLYIIRPDPPPVGEDWLSTVPGQYLYNVTGIYATLTTGGTPTTVMRDSSPHALDGAYVNTPEGAPPIVQGIAATKFDDGTKTTGVVADPIIDWTGDWSVEGWFRSAVGANYDLVQAQQGAAFSTAVSLRVAIDVSGIIFVEGFPISGPDALWETAALAFPNDGLKHQLTVTYDQGTDTILCYVDGASVPITNLFGVPFDLTGIDHVGIVGQVPVSVGGSTFEAAMVAIYPTALSPTAVAFHYGARINGADYVTLVLADNPGAFYQLNDQGGAGGGRQVTLNITDGSNDVERICSGFDALTSPGPYAWSWLPKLNSASESPDASTVTVPLPKEILPAGYTIGTQTLDIEPTDQWSEIAIWWNSDIMDSTQNVTPYEYPPGALLRFIQTQGAS